MIRLSSSKTYERRTTMNDDIINILNLNYDIVQSCYSKKIKNSIYYTITFIRKDFPCPICFNKLIFKDYRPIKIKHEIIRGNDTTIIFNRRRFYCKHCKSFHYEKNYFSSDQSPRFSDQTTMLIMRALKEHSATYSMVAREFNTTPTKVVSIFDTFSQMRKKKFPEVICIDEDYWNRKSKTKYAVVIIDFTNGNIIDVINGRKRNYWHSYLQLIDSEELKQVKYISIDMFEAYRQIKKIYFPSAILSVESFHVIKNINNMLDDERLRIMKLQTKNSVEYYLLKKFNWLLQSKV